MKAQDPAQEAIPNPEPGQKEVLEFHTKQVGALFSRIMEQSDLVEGINLSAYERGRVLQILVKKLEEQHEDDPQNWAVYREYHKRGELNPGSPEYDNHLNRYVSLFNNEKLKTFRGFVLDTFMEAVQKVRSDDQRYHV